jgi:hypothetical protein
MAEFETRLQTFEDRIFSDPDIFDPKGVHHVFSQGLHGRKIDLDKIKPGTELYDELVYLTVRYTVSSYLDDLPDAVVGIANGTNKLAKDVSDEIGGGTLYLDTFKHEGLPRLTADSVRKVRRHEPVFAVEVEDVGTTGRNSLPPALQLRQLGVERVEVVHTVQRSETLPMLDAAGVAYSALIKRLEPSYDAQECLSNPEGFCAQGWKTIPYKKSGLSEN